MIVLVYFCFFLHRFISILNKKKKERQKNCIRLLALQMKMQQDIQPENIHIHINEYYVRFCQNKLISKVKC